MDRTIVIEHPYDRVTLDFSKRFDQILDESQWAAFCRAEGRLYAGDMGMGTNRFQDVCDRDQSQFLRTLWDECAVYVEGDQPEGVLPSVLEARIAQRVARAQAIVVWGPEFLLK